MDRRAFLRRTAPLAVVGLAGCTGGDDTTAPEDTPTPTRTEGSGGGGGTNDTPTATAESGDSPTPTLEPTDSPTPTDTPTATAEPTPTPEPDLEVVVGPGGNLEFSPDSFELSVGDTVVWRWDSGGHNVSPRSTPDGSSWEGLDATTYPAGTTHVHTFETGGTYEYVCTPHQSVGMTGSFTIE